GLPQSRVSLLPNALDLADGFDEPRPPTPRTLRGRWRLIAVSRLARGDVYKNVDKVILALPTILKSFPDTHYFIVGDGAWRTELEHKVHKGGLTDHVHFLGPLDDSALDSVNSQSH